MNSRHGGGSLATRPARKRRKGPGRKDAAYSRAIDILGEEVVKKIRSDWDSWDTGHGGKEWQQSEGVVLQLLQQGLSERVIRAIIPVGGSCVCRLRKVLKEGVDNLHTRRDPLPPWHAFSGDDLERFKIHCGTWILEDGFPCAHRRPRQYFTEPKLTWKIVHARYVDDTTRINLNARTLSYSRFVQYVHFYYPGVRLTRTAEDVCDCCVRLSILLQQEGLSDEDRNALELEKNMHLDEAIAQRRFVSSFVKQYSALHAPHEAQPQEIIPDTIDDEPGEEDAYSTSEECQGQKDRLIQIQAEDFGGGISMPYYGHCRPSADYFNSNLMIQNFVIADISHGRNNVYFYDERGQGKDADALCSLRLLYHLTTIQNKARRGVKPAKISLSILDNCVGQNKSKVVLMFFAMLSVIFPYEKVVLCFLLPGHSHNIADRVVAWCRGAIRRENIYTPVDIVERVNRVKSVDGKFLDHNDPFRPFFVGWNSLLSKYFSPPPPGYTSNYLFEIDRGICTARRSVNTNEEDSITFAMTDIANIESTKKAVMEELFGANAKSIWEASIAGVQLPRYPTRELRPKKLKSLAAKYFSIPSEHLKYYPDVPEAVATAAAAAAATAAQDGADNDNAATTTGTPKHRPGRPKRNTITLKANQPSILQFFSPSKE